MYYIILYYIYIYSRFQLNEIKCEKNFEKIFNKVLRTREIARKFFRHPKNIFNRRRFKLMRLTLKGIQYGINFQTFVFSSLGVKWDPGVCWAAWGLSKETKISKCFKLQTRINDLKFLNTAILTFNILEK